MVFENGILPHKMKRQAGTGVFSVARPVFPSD
jgi:hypothetical protein